MSQQQFNIAGGDEGIVNSVTGTNGVSASPTTGDVVVSGINATTTQIGVVTLATNAQAIAGTNATNAVTPAALAAKLGTQTNNGLAYGGGTSNALNWLADATNGQLPIGSTGNPPVLGNITSLDGTITVTNGPGTIDLSSQQSWTDEASSFSAVSGKGYFVTATATATLPASPSQGNVIAFIVDVSGSFLTVQANTGQFIRIGQNISASAGVAVNNFQGDALRLRYRAADTTWIAESVEGSWTVT